MALSPLAGKRAPKEILTNIPSLMAAYYSNHPNPANKNQAVSFGTSGHRGNSFKTTFNEDHILAIVQSICDFRIEKSIEGPLFLGKDTHALSESAQITALEVLAANGVITKYQEGMGYTPTPVISHAILTYNNAGNKELSDGIVITPSHNPPDNGGIKYNSTNGGPADTDITNWIAERANTYLKNGLKGVKRVTLHNALEMNNIEAYDYITPYVKDLKNVVDIKAIQEADLKIAADALGGAGLAYWDVIKKEYNLNITTYNTFPDPTFQFMCVDKDGVIRMDCSSPYAMTSLIDLKNNYDLAFGNDPDFDRHGIVTPSVGLMNPNHYLAVAIQYLYTNRKGWSQDAAIGKTLVSSSMIDRVANGLGRTLAEVPVGFKWFVNGLVDGSYGFGGEESAGASFLRKDGTAWSTDKDGIILCLLAAEITAVTGKDPGLHYKELVKQYGDPVYTRIDAPASKEQKAILANLSPEKVKADSLAGEKIIAKLTEAPANSAKIGGLKVTTKNGWFAARPSGTEDIYKIYAESFIGNDHLDSILKEAQDIVSQALLG